MSTRFQIRLPRLLETPETFEELRKWIEQGRVEGPEALPFVQGTTLPRIEDRNKPWLRVDTSSGKILGWYVWDRRLADGCGGWRCVSCRILGEIKTVVRTSSTVALDREAKGLSLTYGWQLADDNAIEDLRENTGFFVPGTGEGSEYKIYTVIRVA